MRNRIIVTALIIAGLIETARLNHVDPQASLSEVIDVIADHPINRIDALLPWNWRAALTDDRLVT